MINAAIKSLEKTLLKLERVIERREIYFSNRSALWQDSDKGDNYQITTQDIEQCRDDLDNLIDDLKNTKE